MIRSGLKRLGRRLLGRQPAPARAAPPAPAPQVDAADPSDEVIELEIEADQLRRWADEGRALTFLDIREPYELASGWVEGAVLLPMNQVPARLEEIPMDRTVIVYCAAGARSFGVAHYLREHGIEDAWSLVGGIGAWLQQGGRCVTAAD